MEKKNFQILDIFEINKKIWNCVFLENNVDYLLKLKKKKKEMCK